ncbi:Histone RNA hairpin-binding protein [Diplonema papillatum]|nr:Histone RNA hairpin-binding protein [Diplonema papillatum]|eukprot:gene1945-2954_t
MDLLPGSQAQKPSGLKLPPTATFNPESGAWEETDAHRLAQRAKQISYGKVTLGHRNYVVTVPHHERQDGNEYHPHTPRVDQVCSKRSWDAQIGKWRRMLHAWDQGPAAGAGRPADDFGPSPTAAAEQPAPAPAFVPRQPSLPTQSCFVSIPTNTQPHTNTLDFPHAPSCPNAHEADLLNRERNKESQLPPLKIKCLLVNDTAQHFKLVVSPKNIPFFPFKMLVEEKVKRTVSKIFYTDEDGDAIAADDDMSLKVFLNGAGSVHAPKLFLHVKDELPAETSLASDIQDAFKVVTRHFRFTEGQSKELLQTLLTCPQTPLSGPSGMPPLLSPPASVATVRSKHSQQRAPLQSISPNITPQRQALLSCLPSSLLRSPWSGLNINTDKTPSPLRAQMSLLLD